MYYMKKKIKKIGNSKGITFSKEECEINKIKVGRIIDIPDEVFKE